MHLLLSAQHFWLIYSMLLSKTLNPSVVSTYIYLQPVLASVVAIFLKSDSLDFIKILSVLFIFSAVYLVSIPTKKTIRS